MVPAGPGDQGGAGRHVHQPIGKLDFPLLLQYGREEKEWKSLVLRVLRVVSVRATTGDRVEGRAGAGAALECTATTKSKHWIVVSCLLATAHGLGLSFSSVLDAIRQGVTPVHHTS